MDALQKTVAEEAEADKSKHLYSERGGPGDMTRRELSNLLPQSTGSDTSLEPEHGLCVTASAVPTLKRIKWLPTRSLEVFK